MSRFAEDSPEFAAGSDTLARVIGRSAGWDQVTDPMWDVPAVEGRVPTRDRRDSFGSSSHQSRGGSAEPVRHQAQPDQQQGTEESLPLFPPSLSRSPSPYERSFAFRRVLLPHLRGMMYEQLNGDQRAEVHMRWAYDYSDRKDRGGTAANPPRVIESPSSHTPSLSPPSVRCLTLHSYRHSC